MKSYAYVRVSSIGQLDHDGPERQIQAIREFAAKHNIVIEQEFTEAYTGKELDRPVLQEVIAKLLANGTRTIIIEKLDRLARDIVVQESLIRDFQKRGITLLSTRETDLCSNEPTRVMMRQIIGIMAEYERAMIVFRTKASRDRIRARGDRCEGRKPFGQHPDYPQEKETLALMIDLEASGSNPSEIAEHLNRAGILPRQGKKFHQNTVRRILQKAAA